MHHTRTDLVAILSVALGKIPYKDLGPLADRSYQIRNELHLELAEYLEAELLLHFEVKRRPIKGNGLPPEPGDPRPKPWRGRR